MNGADGLEYVGFWLRVWATLIDTFLVTAIVFPIMMAVFGRDQLASGITIEGPAYYLIWYVLPAIAVIAFWNTKHATPGKMVFGAKIVDAQTGGSPSFKQHIVRYLGYFLSTFFFGLGFLWVAFDRKKQGWHDKLAGTVVVRPMKGHAEPVRFG